MIARDDDFRHGRGFWPPFSRCASSLPRRAARMQADDFSREEVQNAAVE